MLNIIKGKSFKIFSTISFVVLFITFFLPTNVYAVTETEPTLTEILNEINSSLIDVGVETNLLCYFSNPTVCTSLYFEGKISNSDTGPYGIKIGKIEFLNPIDLTNTDVQNFLSNLHTLITFTNGTVGINMDNYATLIGNSTGLNFAAKITMYNIKTSVTPSILVFNGINLNDPLDKSDPNYPIISEINFDESILTFKVNHFTTFVAAEPSPELQSVNARIFIRSYNIDSYKEIKVGIINEYQDNDYIMPSPDFKITGKFNMNISFIDPIYINNGAPIYISDTSLLNDEQEYGTFTINPVDKTEIFITQYPKFNDFKVGKYILTIKENLVKGLTNEKDNSAIKIYVNILGEPIFNGGKQNIITEAMSNSGAVVNFDPPYADDYYDGKILSVCNPVSGYTFNLGRTRVICIATDSNGNKSKEFGFDITVVDTTKPVIKLIGNSIVEIYKGNEYIDLEATVSDIVDGEFEIEGIGNVDSGQIGQYIINYNYTDNAKNSATQISRTINVINKPSTNTSSGSYQLNIPLFQNNSQPSLVEPVLTNTNQGQVLGAASYNFTKFMKFNSRGLEVIELQKFLNQAGFNSGKVDGIFGPITKAALIKFQLENNLKGDGIVGPLTRAVLNK